MNESIFNWEDLSIAQAMKINERAQLASTPINKTDENNMKTFIQADILLYREL